MVSFEALVFLMSSYEYLSPFLDFYYFFRILTNKVLSYEFLSDHALRISLKGEGGTLGNAEKPNAGKVPGTKGN